MRDLSKRIINSDALNGLELRLQAVVSNATVAIFMMDDKQRCVYMNPAAEKLTGFSLAEVIELDVPLHDIIHHTHPDGSHFPIEDCVIDRAFPERNQVQGESVFINKAGEFFPVAFTASPIQGEAIDVVGTVIEVRDITEEKRNRARQQLLLNELDHRVKNSLAIVQSLAWQSFKDIDSDAFLRFNGRMRSLASAQSLLTDGFWQKASLREIIEASISPFDVSRITAEGPQCYVTPKVAVSLSMVLHELLTNAVKYGALSNDTGTVSLKWAYEVQNDFTEIEVVWREQGGPTVAVPARRGFGSRLIERHFAMEFGGKAELQFETDGLVCEMQMQVPKINDL